MTVNLSNYYLQLQLLVLDSVLNLSTKNGLISNLYYKCYRSFFDSELKIQR